MKQSLSQIFYQESYHNGVWILFCIDHILVQKWALHCVGTTIKYLPSKEREIVRDCFLYAANFLRGGKGNSTTLRKLRNKIFDLKQDNSKYYYILEASGFIIETIELNPFHKYYAANLSANASAKAALAHSYAKALFTHSFTEDINIKHFQNKLVSKFPSNIYIEKKEDIIVIHKDNKTKHITLNEEIDTEFLSKNERNVKDILE